GAAEADWYDAIYISDDEIFDGSDTFITSQSISEQTPLAADGSYTITSNITLPNRITSVGNRYLLFRTDHENNQLETDETNNTFPQSWGINPSLPVIATISHRRINSL
ncbi:CARDB domain-containing protein, partial [Anabaenopsis elenkinii]